MNPLTLLLSATTALQPFVLEDNSIDQATIEFIGSNSSQVLYGESFMHTDEDTHPFPDQKSPTTEPGITEPEKPELPKEKAEKPIIEQKKQN